MTTAGGTSGAGTVDAHPELVRARAALRLLLRRHRVRPRGAPLRGRHAGVPAAYAAAAGYQGVLDAGVQRIRERSVSLTQPLLEDALARGFTVRSPHDPAQRGGHVTIDLTDDPGQVAQVHDDLLRRGFVVDARPGVGIRVGPHFYTRADECTAVRDEMEKIVREL